ncbi:MAG TPA: LamG-like jellyroll fold domain-containing protein, partial [Bacillota bacterium]|nr:LamG-like jellyroll fold domain-containing protein [Bacillota bacterium]
MKKYVFWFLFVIGFGTMYIWGNVFAQTNPVVWYSFDQTSGSTATDSSGNAKNATLTGATWAAGHSGNAVSLSGSNQYVSLPAGIVSALNDFTIATWVRLNTVSTWSRIFDFGTGTTVNMFLTPTSGSTIRFAITTSGSGGEQRINGSAALPGGSWKHVAVTLNGNTGVLYVDGVEVGRNSSMTLKPSNLGNTTLNYIGKSQYNDAYLNGLVDDFRIYDRALSTAEVNGLFNGTNPTTSPTGSSIVPTPTGTGNPLPSGYLSPVYLNSTYKVNSTFWNARIKNTITNWIPWCYNQLSNTNLAEGGIDNFVQAGNKLAGRSYKAHVGLWFSNAYVLNTIEAMCTALMVDPQGDSAILSAQNAMRTKLNEWIPKILSAQESDGYLQTWTTLGNKVRWSDREAHEGYVAGYFIEAGIAHYLMTGKADTTLYNAARRCADCWVNNIGTGKKTW